MLPFCPALLGRREGMHIDSSCSVQHGQRNAGPSAAISSVLSSPINNSPTKQQLQH